MDEFVTLLRSIESNDSIRARNGFIPEHHPDIYRASALASEILINGVGKCAWRNMELLAMEGFEVFPIEKDQFGWLVGGIQTRKGVITYS